MSRRNKAPPTPKPESRASKLLKLVEKGPEPSDQSSKGFVLQFQAALIPAAGAVYLLGYLARVNPDYFSLLTVGDFVTSAIMFFPFSIMLMLLPVLGRAFSERVNIHMTILYPLWLKRGGEWSGAFKFMLRTVAVISVLTLSLPFFVSLRMGERFDPVAGFLTAIWTCFILNEVRCYAMVRYKQQVIWGGQLIVALYLMTTSFFIGHLYAQLHASLDLTQPPDPGRRLRESVRLSFLLLRGDQGPLSGAVA